MADGEEKADYVAKLKELRTIRELTGNLNRAQHKLREQDAQAERDRKLAIELREERALLRDERQAILRRLRLVQDDLDAIDSAIVELDGQLNIKEQRKREILVTEYEPCKDELDRLRVRHNLPKLPTLQEVEEREMARILEERRQAWYASSQEASPGASAASSPAAAAQRGRGRPPKRRRSGR